MQLHDLDETVTPPGATAYERTPIRPEAALESLLHANPGLLLDEPLLVVGRQVRLETGIADLVALDQFGNVVVCEVKVGRSGTGSASEETILSQPQAYSSALGGFDYDDLNDQYREYRDRLAGGEWDVDPAVAPGGTLREAVEATFGTGLDDHEFNVEQRMVVVAEEITRRTAANVRYLLEQGLHFQAAEVQLFAHPEDGSSDTVLASSMVVDYDVDRVRPPNRPAPTYPHLVAELVEPVFPELQETVRAESLSDVFPDGFDSRGPALESRRPDHPEGVVYYVSPEPDNERVTIGLHNTNELPEVVERILAERDAFEQAGLTVQDNQRYNLVVKRWDVETIEDVWDFQPEISEHYERLVVLGHEVLVDG